MQAKFKLIWYGERRALLLQCADASGEMVGVSTSSGEMVGVSTSSGEMVGVSTSIQRTPITQNFHPI